MMAATAAGNFVLFGPAHLTVLALAVLTPVVLVLAARRGGARVQLVIRWAIAVVLVGNELAYEIYGLAVEGPGEFLRAYLPLHLCGVAVFVVAWAMVRPGQRVFELAYFWGLAGTLQAIITPDLRHGFPDYRFIEFFVNHGLIVAGAVFAVAAMRMRPSPGCVWRLFWMTNALAAVAGLADWAIGGWRGGANYMFMCDKPGVGNPLFFLDWPWYIPVIEVVGLLLITALYAPFWLAGRRRGARRDFP